MIAALFALAAAMIIGGCAAVIQGFPYVRLESGLAMVIAGSVAASSGAVILGLGLVAAGLRRVERALSMRSGGSAEIRTASEGASQAMLPMAPDGRPRLPPILPVAPSFVVPPAPTVESVEHADAQRIDPGPRLDIGNFPLSDPHAPVEPELPIPGLAPAPVPAPAASEPPHPAEPIPAPEPPVTVPAEDDLFAAPEPAAHEGDAHGTLALRPSLNAVPEPPEPEAPVRERKVVGRYASGGNTYVMFEDGVIEAETPQGRFTFASLDELKAFVDGGGEAATRGAA